MKLHQKCAEASSLGEKSKQILAQIQVLHIAHCYFLAQKEQASKQERERERERVNSSIFQELDAEKLSLKESFSHFTHWVYDKLNSVEEEMDICKVVYTFHSSVSQVRP